MRNDEALGLLASASKRAGLEGLSRRLDDLRELCAGDLAVIEEELGALLAPAGEDGGLAERTAAHLLGQPGKRIRPLCALLGARIASAANDRRVHDVAVACELVHAATLLHDDVIDEGTERRGAPAARIVFGNSASILGGDYLLIEALERVQRADPALLSSLLRTIARMVAAEALQLERRGSLEPSRELYVRIADGKTARLFRWALVAGARLGRLSQDELTALGEVGMALGRAFQLVDDALDLEGDPSLIGKDLHADLLQGKLTWPLLVAAERDPELLAVARAFAASPDGDLLDALLARVRAAGGIEATRAFASEQARAAEEALAVLPDGAPRRALLRVVELALSRGL